MNDDTIQKYIGKVIKEATLADNITLRFEDGTIEISDEGQSCCENRYITSDDDFNTLAGSKLINIKVKEVDDKKTESVDDYEVHEIAFLEISTDKVTIIAETHNVHNGYYGGFSLEIKEVNSADQKSA